MTTIDTLLAAPHEPDWLATEPDTAAHVFLEQPDARHSAQLYRAGSRLGGTIGIVTGTSAASYFSQATLGQSPFALTTAAFVVSGAFGGAALGAGLGTAAVAIGRSVHSGAGQLAQALHTARHHQVPANHIALLPTDEHAPPPAYKPIADLEEIPPPDYTVLPQPNSLGLIMS